MRLIKIVSQSFLIIKGWSVLYEIVEPAYCYRTLKWWNLFGRRSLYKHLLTNLVEFVIKARQPRNTFSSTSSQKQPGVKSERCHDWRRQTQREETREKAGEWGRTRETEEKGGSGLHVQVFHIMNLVQGLVLKVPYFWTFLTTLYC